MEPHIEAYRISFIWTHVALAPVDPQGKLSRLRQRAGFEAAVDALRAANGRDDELRLPWWRKAPPHFFWLYYFSRALPDCVSGSQAYKALASLQLSAFSPRFKAADEVAGEIKAYIAPQAFAIVADLAATGTLGAEAWVDRCQTIRQNTYDMAIGGQATASRSLRDAAEAARGVVCGLLGYAAPDTAMREPFTIVTPVKGNGVNAAEPPPEQALRWAHGVSDWPPAWRQVAPDPAGLIKLRRGDLANSDFLYGTKRGRTMWKPSRFLPTPTQKPVSALSCYHRNMTFATLQVDMLLEFVRALAQADDDTLLRWSTEARMAAGLLGRLHGGNDDIYRSASIARQIDDSGLIDTINQLRTRYNMKDKLVRP